jgi:hypothetical protein
MEQHLKRAPSRSINIGQTIYRHSVYSVRFQDGMRIDYNNDSVCFALVHSRRFVFILLRRHFLLKQIFSACSWVSVFILRHSVYMDFYK